MTRQSRYYSRDLDADVIFVPIGDGMQKRTKSGNGAIR
jgi:hypothetical protein